MPGGMPLVQGSSQAWASEGDMWSSGFNSGWVLDQNVGSTGLMATNVAPGSSSTFFYSTGDALGFYVHGRRLWIVQGANTIFAEVVSSSCGPLAGTTQLTQVTIGAYQPSATTGLSTGSISTVAASMSFPSTGGAGQGNHPNDFGTSVMIRNWGL